MVEAINVVVALATILFGALALFWPNFALGAVKLQPVDGHRDGLSEIRAASGGAYVGTGALAILLAPLSPVAWLMLGAHYIGAAGGRLLSIAVDGSGTRKMWMFFAIEAVCAAWLVAANAGALGLG